MRKILLIVVIIVFIVSLVENKKSEEIRVRIIPNSNEFIDLEIKESVKGSIIYYLHNIYDESYEIYKKNISNSIVYLEEIIEKQFCECEITFDYHTLYNKTYNDNIVKNEESLVLLIVLGKGKGDNWWGSIYPKYLEVSGDDVVLYRSLFVDLIKQIKGE